MHSIRYNQQIQAQVDQRLCELADIEQTGTSTKVKSQGGGGGIDVFVCSHIKWSHEFVLSGSAKGRILYRQLTMPQCLTGSCCTMREEINQTWRNHMINC